MPEITETFFAQTRKTWREWLRKHADSKSEIWLIFNKKHVREPCVALQEAVEEALCFGWIDGILKRIDDRQHAVRFTPRLKNSRWSESNKERVERLIRAGQMTDRGMALVEHAKQTGEWEKARGTLKDQPVPSEFHQFFEQDQEARTWFDGLAPSHRRQYLAWIYEAKRPETRLRRIEKVQEMIRSRQKPGI